MSRYAIRLAGLRGKIEEASPDQAIGAFEWLAEYDPDRFEGRGFVRWTFDPAEALSFASMTEAIYFAMTISDRLPVRADGKPNRPLTAFHLEFQPVPEVAS